MAAIQCLEQLLPPDGCVRPDGCIVYAVVAAAEILCDRLNCAACLHVKQKQRDERGEKGQGSREEQRKGKQWGAY